MDKISRECIRATARVEQLGDKVIETRLRRFGHVQRWIPWTKEFEDGAARQEKDRNPQRRFMDVGEDGMQRI